MNYPHGAGHGVGSFLNVHEGPISMSYKWRGWQATLAEGNVLSNEPGYYEDGAFGVRIEDMMIAVNKETKFLTGGKPFIGFENVTVVPYCRKLIDTSLLTKDELDWLNATNAYTLEKTKPLLQGNDLALAWLERETQPYA
jgi:Xaa-Pro aminopeptidase